MTTSTTARGHAGSGAQPRASRRGPSSTTTAIVSVVRRRLGRLGHRRDARRARSSPCSWPSGRRTCRRISRSGACGPLHTNAVIFAFVGNMVFAGIYYSTQRLVKARLRERCAREDPLLGLAAHHRRGRDHAAPRLHPGQGVRGARMADRHRDRRSSGSSSRSSSSGRSRGGPRSTCTSPSGSTSRRS